MSGGTIRWELVPWLPRVQEVKLRKFLGLWLGMSLLTVESMHAQAPQGAFRDGLLNAIVAIVNDSIITTDESVAYSRTALQMMSRRIRSQADFDREAARITQMAVEDLVNRRLIVDEFRNAGFAFPESYVDDMIKRRIRDEFGGDRLTLIRELRAVGQTEEAFRRSERENFIVLQMRIKNINQQIIISPKKIERYYQENQDKFRVGDRVKIRMITLSMDRHPRDEAEAMAAEAMAKLKAGVEFAEVANEFSDDARRFRGGDRGWFDSRDSDLREELKEVAFNLSAGTLSDVIDVGGALFILRVEEKNAAQVRPLNEVRNEIEAELRTQEEQRLEKAWVNRLRAKSFIRYF